MHTLIENLHKPLMFFDIEADNLLFDVSRTWCIIGYAESEEHYHIYVDPQEALDKQGKLSYPKNSTIYTNIKDYLILLNKYYLIGHNILSYDLSLLRKLYYFKYDVSIHSLADTMIMSRLFFPDRDGHSLEYWGEKLRFPKGDHKDFSCLSQEMLNYCKRDVDLTRRVYYTLIDEAGDWDWSSSLMLEYRMQDIQTRQEEYGVLFNKEKAEELVVTLNKEISEIEQTVIPQIPRQVKMIGQPVTKIFKKNGDYTEQVKQWISGGLSVDSSMNQST